jgi:hypothetical protein
MAALSLLGCVPEAIKQEIDFMDTVVQIGVTETENFDSTDDIDDKIRFGQQAIGALRRLKPHSANLKRWVEGEEPDAE